MALQAAIPFISLGIKALTSGASFIQARKFKKKQEAAERAADEALADARKKISVNYFEGISLPTEAYERAMEGVKSTQQQVIQAAQEAESRGLAATAGRAVMAGQEAQRGIAGSLAERLFGLQQLAAEEESRLAGLGAQLDLYELEGQQAQAQTAEAARQAQLQRGITAAGEVLKGAGELIPEYMPTPEVRAANKLQRQLDRGIRRGDVQPGTTLGEFGQLGATVNTSGLAPVSTSQTMTLPTGMVVNAPSDILGGSVSIDYADTLPDVLAAFEQMTPMQRRQYFANR